MRQVFLAEPYGDVRLLRAVLGPDLPPPGAPAVLPGHAIAADQGGLRLAPVRMAGAVSPGQVVDLDAGQRARLEYWRVAIGAKPLVAGVECGGARRVVDTFLGGAEPERSWTPEAWAGEWHAIVCEAAEEVMRHFDQREPEDMAERLLGIGFRAVARARGAASATPLVLRSGLTVADVTPVRLDLPYTEYFCVEEHHLAHRRFDGAMSAPMLRAAFVSGDAVTVLPFDPRAGTVLLIEQFRAGPLARRDPRPWCLETIAGRCDPLETVEATARREAVEEAGLVLGRLEQVAAYYPSPGILGEHITGFVGEADLSGAGGGWHGLDAEQEDIRSLVVPLPEAMAAVASGEINNAPLLVSLLWLAANAARLRADWG
ncbi:MAG: NUDIX domain-containing protein [Amaricoccus sp.]